MNLKQGQQQKFTQRLSPLQMQLMMLLQMPVQNIEERIRQELSENPALELAAKADADDNINTQETTEENYNNDEEFISSGTGDNADYNDYQDNTADDDNGFIDKIDRVNTVETNFHDHLLAQFHAIATDQTQKIIGEQIIGSLDDDGYLRRKPDAMVDDLAFAKGIYTTTKEVKKVLQIIYHLEPLGVGAQTLQECLELQLVALAKTSPPAQLALTILQKHFEDFTKKKYQKICSTHSITELQLKDAIAEIIKLNPKPGAAFSTYQAKQNYIIPDFYINNQDGELEITLNNRNIPSLRICSEFKQILTTIDEKKSTDQKNAAQYVRHKLEGAKTFLEVLRQRERTLTRTMRAIVNAQKEFFLTGDERKMQPLVLKHLAAVTGLDISTLSRTTNSKYVQTEFGTYKLKHFFSESIKNTDGKAVSLREVRFTLAQVVEEEDPTKPLTDDQLTVLMREKGYPVARRTVAKYREILGFPTAKMRTKLH